MNSLLHSQKQIIGLSKYHHHHSFKYATAAQICIYKLGKYKFNKIGVRDYSMIGIRPHLYIKYDQNTHTPSADAFRYPITLLPIASLNNRLILENNFSTSSLLHEQHSSKVEAAVKKIKESENEKIKEEISKMQTPAITTVLDTGIKKADMAKLKDTADKLSSVLEKKKDTDVATPKKPLRTRIWEEIIHYYHGFRLLFIDINVCRKLLWQVLNGEQLTRREHRLLIRTTSDLFRLLPFSVFVIVPFMELLLPVAIKLFPGMLPSTFQTAKDNEDKMKQSLKVKLEMAKFLQKTLDEMGVQAKDHKSADAKSFVTFIEKIRNTATPPTNEEIMKYSKLFEDEITLDSLNRQQLTALCRVLETNTLGTNNLLRFQLRMKLRSLAADDRMIQKEGVNSLNLDELQLACRARGMRAYGLSEEKLRFQLQEWINLSLNEKVPPSLLLLSRALMLPEHVPTSDKLKATMSTLPEMVVTQAKAAIGELEGKIDNKTKIEIIRDEQRRIKEEKEEQKETEKVEKAKIAEILVDKAPIITTDDLLKTTAERPALEKTTVAAPSEQTVSPPSKPIEVKPPQAKDETISSKDIEALGDALETLFKDTKKVSVEKEVIKDLKEEISDYQEDVKELQEVVATGHQKVEIKESKAAKNLFKKVNSMISKIELDLEKTEQKLKAEDKSVTDELVNIEELLRVIKQLQKIPDDSKIEQIEKMLGKIDIDQDGQIRVDDLLKVIETIGKDKVKLDTKQVNELIELMAKEEKIETEEKIKKEQQKACAAATPTANILSKVDKIVVASAEKTLTHDVVKQAIEKQTEQILPKQQSTIPPPQIPTPGATQPKDKML